MMDSTVFIKNIVLPEVDRKEVLRYAGGGQSDGSTEALIESCIAETAGLGTGRVCYMTVPVSVLGDTVDLGFAAVKSVSLAKYLKAANKAVLFAATVGLGYDRLINKYSKISPVRSVVLDAVGSERIECLCDAFCEELRKSFSGRLLPRFSPGYGDLPLEFQKEIFKELDCPKKIGLTLNGSLLMSPSKSVTAIVGTAER